MRKTILLSLAALAACSLAAFAQSSDIKQTAAGTTVGTRTTSKLGFFGAPPATRPTSAALTENSTSIGGTNDGNLPSLTATAATLTGSLTGTVDGVLANVSAIALSTTDTYSDAAVNTAVNAAITSTNVQLKELQTTLNAVIADNVALRAAARENAAAINNLRTLLVTLGLTAAP